MTWCVLRTNGARTLPLAKALVAAGFDAWTPMRIDKRRAHRAGKAMVEREAPLLPTFVFVQADRLLDLHMVLALPVNPYPAFSIFRYNGRVPLLADREIERLRMAERKAAPKEKARTFAPGAKVKTEEGPYAGLSGVVKQGDGRFTLVAFGGWMDVKIETFVLLPDAVQHPQPVTGAAA